MIKTLFVFGTRPEAIKLCPVLRHMQSAAQQFAVEVCVTAQHRTMLDQVLTVFGVTPDYDLNLMQPAQTLSESTSRMMAALDPVLQKSQPDLVVVQGDTTTTFCGALAAFYRHIPVAHVEAGLRTGDLQQPFPEELNRVLTTRLASLHFAATEGAAQNLKAEGINPKTIFVTGNSGIDAVLHVRNQLLAGERKSLVQESGFLPDSARGKKWILVTAHRRESFGPGFERICLALKRLAKREDVHLIYPVHRNPNVVGPVEHHLGNLPQVSLIPPLEYVPFVDLMRNATLILTDSGGVQEEGPSLGKPVLVMRDKTERPEGVEAGTVRLVGTDPDHIYRETVALLENPEQIEQMSRIHNPYGDGQASQRIAREILFFFKKN